jgi:DNA-binding NarL/FixJ family response regulator
MRVLVADDQIKVRSALKVLLGQHLNWEVVGETGEAELLFVQICDARPDVVLLDWELPGLTHDGEFSDFRARFPNTKIIALSGRPEARRAALELGVDAFVSKMDSPERLLDTLAALRTELMGNGTQSPEEQVS